MDDAWFHTLSSVQPAASKPRAQHARRASLLQQPAEEKSSLTVEAPIDEREEEVDDPWSGPPKATLARRAQSYSDFYDAARVVLNNEKRAGRKTSLEGLRGVQRVDSAELAFEEDYAGLEDGLLEASQAEYQIYYEQLQLSQSHLDSLLANTTSTLRVLSSLSDSFKAVESQTETFRQQCEGLISEQRRLTSLADGIEENARYYTYLEPMTRWLNAPGASKLVTRKDFPEMLSNLDNCLAYMETHSDHKESATYRSRYRLLLTRALTLVRQHFTNSLRQIAADVSQRISAGQLKDATQSALLYAKFRVPAPELKALALEIQKRAVPTPDDVDAGREPEYAGLMRELYQSYSATRGRLVLPMIAKKMAEIASIAVRGQTLDLLAFSRSAVGFVRGICLDEFDLWQEWFESTGEAVYDFLESLIEPMFDYLRPRIIHEMKLEKLCELCAMIQGRYMEAESEDEDEVAMSPVYNGKPTTQKLDFAVLIHPALEDAQTRLVFLALGILRDGIENYKPTAQDLDIATHRRKFTTTTNGAKREAALSGTRERSKASAPTTPATPMPKTPLIVDQDGDDADTESPFSTYFSQHQPSTPSDSRTWYPTLPKAIWLLRRIYRLVNSSVFDDLAHHIVHSTTTSLLSTSHQIGAQHSTPDAHLFLITHLLHLKQQIVAFDIEFVTPEITFDWTGATLATFYELRERGALWNPASWVRLVGGAVGGGLLPTVVENMLDAKAELDARLRGVINAFVDAYASRIVAPIAPAERARGDFEPLKAVRTVRGLAEKVVPGLRAKLEEFIQDARTRETLVAAVRDGVVGGYDVFFEAQSGEGGRRLSRKGKGREDEVWAPDLFGEAVGRVFGVGEADGGGSGSGNVSE